MYGEIIFVKGVTYMKRFASLLIVLLLVFSVTACEGMSVSTKRYDKISSYVLENIDTLSPKKEIEFPSSNKQAGFSLRCCLLILIKENSSF